jgi:hypothetical protein
MAAVAATTGCRKRRRKRIFPEEKSCINDVFNEIAGKRCQFGHSGLPPKANLDPIIRMIKTCIGVERRPMMQATVTDLNTK